MKLLHSITVCIVISLQANAQNRNLDSLLERLSLYSVTDTSRIVLLQNISEAHAELNPDTAIRYSTQAIDLSKRLKSEKLLGQSYLVRGGQYFRTSAQDSLALQDYTAALKIFERLDLKQEAGRALHAIGLWYNSNGEFTTAITHHQKAVTKFTAIGDSLSMARALNSIGVNNYQMARYPEAYTYYLKALTTYESIANKKGEAQTLGNMGLVMWRMGDLQKAMSYQRNALKIEEQLGNKQNIARALDHIGTLYDELNNTVEAIAYYKKALQYNTELAYQQGVAVSLSNIGIAEISIRKYDSARAHLLQSATMFTDLHEKKSLATVLLNLGDVYMKMPKTISGMPASKSYHKALTYFDSCLQLATTMHNVDLEARAWQGMSTAYEKLNQPLQALSAYKQFTTLNDSLKNDEAKADITRRDMQYEFDKKEAVFKATEQSRQQLARAEMQQQKLVSNAAIGSGLILLLAGTLVFIFYKRKNDALIKQTTAEFEAQVSHTEMKALRSQMNPHFIFNSLNSIVAFIEKQDAAAASSYTIKFSKLMRLILENSEKKEISVAEELHALQIYMDLEAIRLNHKFLYSINVAHEVDPEKTFIPPLLLQPFVENSIWHGIAKKDGNGLITINVCRIGNSLHCIVEDNGIGKINGTKTNGHQSMGMKLTQARINIIKRSTDADAAVTQTELPQGLRVELKLPFDSGN